MVKLTFKIFDEDGDGNLSHEEFMKVGTVHLLITDFLCPSSPRLMAKSLTFLQKYNYKFHFYVQIIYGNNLLKQEPKHRPRSGDEGQDKK